MMMAYLYDSGGSLRKLYFDPLAVESFTEDARPGRERIVVLAMRSGEHHTICNRDGIVSAIYQANRDVDRLRSGVEESA